MAALPQPFASVKKTVSRAVKAATDFVFRRDERKLTKQFGVIPRPWFADLARLTKGHLSQGNYTLLLLLFYIRTSCCARAAGGQKGDPVPEWSEPLAFRRLAELFCCDMRALQSAIALGVERNLLQMRKAGKEKAEFRLLSEKWAELPDYVAPAPADAKDEPDSEDEPLPDDPAHQDIREPVCYGKRGKVRAGQAKTIRVKYGVAKLTFEHHGSGAIEAEFWHKPGGELVAMTFEVPTSSKISNIASGSRSAHRESTDNDPAHELTRESRSALRNDSLAGALVRIPGWTGPAPDPSGLSLIRQNISPAPEEFFVELMKAAKPAMRNSGGAIHISIGARAQWETAERVRDTELSSPAAGRHQEEKSRAIKVLSDPSQPAARRNAAREYLIMHGEWDAIEEAEAVCV